MLVVPLLVETAASVAALVALWYFPKLTLSVVVCLTFFGLRLAQYPGFRRHPLRRFTASPVRAKLPDSMQMLVYSRMADNEHGIELRQGAPPNVMERGEVLVKVHAAAINPVDWKMARDAFVPWLRAPGFDLAGVVVETRSARFRVGDRVYGTAEYGSLREYAVVVSELITHAPVGLSHVEAAAMVMAWKTSYEGMVERGGLRRNDRVLVLGGSGGCGSAAVQIAHRLGAVVDATCSSANVPYVRGIGADAVFDYKKGEGPAAGTHYALVYDTVGRRASFEATDYTWDKFVTIAQKPRWGDSMERFTMRLAADNLALAAPAVEEGAFKMNIEATFKLSQFTEAFARLKTQRTRGKIVFLIAEEEEE